MSVLNLFKKSGDANLGQTLMRLARWAEATHQQRASQKGEHQSTRISKGVIRHHFSQHADGQASGETANWNEADWNDETVVDYALPNEQAGSDESNVDTSADADTDDNANHRTDKAAFASITESRR